MSPGHTLSCATCGESPARHYYLGARCETHAPAERQVVEHAVQRATRRTVEEAAIRERATTRPNKEFH